LAAENDALIKRDAGDVAITLGTVGHIYQIIGFLMLIGFRNVVRPSVTPSVRLSVCLSVPKWLNYTIHLYRKSV